MLHKLLLFFVIFYSSSLLSTSPIHAQDTNCTLDYPVCHVNLPPGGSLGVCLSRSSANQCTTSTGQAGSWCCPVTLPTPTRSPAVTPRPTIIPSCVVNGNYCVPSGESCETGHVRGSGGLCQTNFVCCAVPVPTVPPGGAPPPIPLPTYPTNFSPLEYPCYETAEDEFHPLRPYPASPCDPLIPAKTEPYPMSFACGKSLNTQGEYRFSRLVSNFDALPEWNESTAEPNVLYRCGTDVCTTKRSVFDITLDLSPARIPVVGNTQDPISDAAKVNNYLSWYLAGTNPTWLDDLPTNTQGTTNTQCIGNALSTYMNTIIGGTEDLGNIRLTSPAFNLTNPIEQDIFTSMVDAGANFSQIDSFAGNTYTLNGVQAYDWVTSSTYRGSDGRTWKEKFTSFNKPLIFTEFGDFDTFGQSPEIPNPVPVIDAMTQEYAETAGDSFIRSINYFNAFGQNPSFIGHLLGDVNTNGELGRITAANSSKAGVNSAIGVDSSGQFHTRIQANRGGWSVELFFSPGDLDGVVRAANHAHEHGITPIFRPCFGNNCDFAEATVYVQFIRDVAARVTNQNREIWFIAGPNEPAGEPWAAPQCSGSAAGVPVADIDRFLTYAGPIKKLLPQSALDVIRYTMKAHAQGTLLSPKYLHDYRLDLENRRMSGIPSFHQFDPQSLWAKLFQRVPLATVEDTVGEVTVGLVTATRADGTSPQPPDVYVVDPSDPKAMRLTIKTADSRLYFPHLKTVTSLIEVLNAISRPYSSTRNYNTDYRNTTQPIEDHQGFNPDQTAVQTQPFGEGGWPDNVITRNTEIIENQAAPVALFGQTNHLEFDQRCDLTTLQMAEGDNLFGQQISGKLTYTQKYRFTPISAPAGSNCITQDPGCASGNCNSCSMPENPDPSLPEVCPLAGNCAWRDGNNRRYCSATITEFCGTFANITGAEITLPTEARVGVFTKTPLIDAFYDNLISASDSFFRRFINWYPHVRGTPDTVIRRGSLTIPVKTQVGYDADNTTDPLNAGESNPDRPAAGAGNNTGGPEIYFPRLGSLADYFLGGPTNERLNLQKMLRPKNFGSTVGPAGAGILAACQPYLSNFPGAASIQVVGTPNVFSKVGDSITVSDDFLDPFGGSYNLGLHTALQPAITFYNPGSFRRNTSAAGVGWNVGNLTANDFAVLKAEYDENNPSTAIIMIGTNDSGGPNPVDAITFRNRLRSAINYTTSRGIIPILSTIPHLTNANPQHNANTETLSAVIKELSVELGIPLVDYRLATEQINTESRNWGISTDNIHPSVGGGNAGDLSELPLSEGGYNVRNFVTMCALDAVWKTRLGGSGGPTQGGSCSYTNADLESAITQAATRYGVPVSMLRAIHGIESFPYDPQTGKIFTCSDNYAQAAGPFQIVRKDADERNSTYHSVTCAAERTVDSCERSTGTLSRCNIYDSAELAARVLLSKVGGWNFTQCRDAGNISESNLPDVYNAACSYYGVFTPDSATDARGRDNPPLQPRSDGARFNYCDVVCGRMKQANPSLSYCPAYPAQREQ